jgi:phasin family protein
MAIKKIENGPRPSKVTTSAVADGRNDGNEPSTTGNQINNANRGEAHMDGSQGKTFDATRTLDSLTKTTEQITSFSQGNVEAIMRSGQVWAVGCQAISKTMAATAQTHLDQTMSAWRALITVKSLREAMDLRASLTHAPFETAFAEAGKLTDASMKLVEETMAPITERITLAAEKFKQPAN